MTTKNDYQSLHHAWQFSQAQVEKLIQTQPADYYPMYTVDGKWGQDLKRWTHWCDGFLPGMMFLFAKRERSDQWLQHAIARSTPLEDRQYDRAVHDLGFVFFSTYLRWLELGGPKERIEPVLNQAGQTMAMRFMERGQYLRSFVEPASLFIDIMMNVGTLFRAGAELSDEHLLQIAHRHCETTRRTIVRGDGSTSHEAIFDLNSGECLRQTTHQGYRGDSCWSRGLAWSLYGFTRSFEQTGRDIYLQTAQNNAQFLIENTPIGQTTPWDYDAPDEELSNNPLSRRQVDTSAAAIAASGLFDLARLTPDPILAASYRDFALQSLQVLADSYLGDKTPNFEGVLNGGVYHIHKDLGIGEAVMFGEYFFVEALDKAFPAIDAQNASASTSKQIVTPYPETSLPDWAKNYADGPTD